MKINFIFIFILIFILSFSEFFLKMININIPSGYKQFLIILYFIINIKSFFISFNSNKFYKYVFLVLIFFSFINFFVEKISTTNYIIGLTFTFLFHITFITSLSIRSDQLSLKRLLQSIVIIFFVASIFSLSSFIINFDYRAQITLFKELGAYGTAINFALIFSITLKILTKNKLYLYLAFFFTFAIFTTLLKKSIIDCFIIWIIYMLVELKLKNIIQNFISFTLLIYLMLIPFKKDLLDNISYQIDYMANTSTEGVRIIMYITAYNLSINKFPFGSGLGTFGAPSSIYNEYSKTYYETGINLIHELSPDLVMEGLPHTLFDTFWPHILGELGFLGTCLFLILWIYPLVRLYKLVKKCKILNLKYQHIYFLNLAMFFVITFDGFTLFIPEIPLFVILYNVIAGLSLNYLYNLVKINYEYSFS